ncbi:unnamed protein product [Coregonus sp. 'balchen']|nr:unnamed protein product [Coregonus sp. 'balchen']
MSIPYGGASKLIENPSHFLYPCKLWKSGDGHDNALTNGDGKYELNILIYACVLDSDSGLQQTLTNAPNWCCHLLSMWITKQTAFKVPLPQMVKSKKKKLKPST